MIEQGLFDFDMPKDNMESKEHTNNVDLFTSYHSVARNGDISISFRQPKYQSRAITLFYELTPPYVMNLRNPYTFMVMPDDEYIDRFLSGLHRLSAKSIFTQLQELSKGNTPCIVCFEKYDKMCHRHIVADWLRQELSITIQERDIPSGYIFDDKRFLYTR